MAASSGKISVTVTKTIQEEQYEPLQVSQSIEETCSKKEYDARLIELTGMLSDNIYDFLDGDPDNPGDPGEVVDPEDPEEPEEALGPEEPEDPEGAEEEDDFFNFGEDDDDVPI